MPRGVFSHLRRIERLIKETVLVRVHTYQALDVRYEPLHLDSSIALKAQRHVGLARPTWNVIGLSPLRQAEIKRPKEAQTRNEDGWFPTILRESSTQPAAEDCEWRRKTFVLVPRYDIALYRAYYSYCCALGTLLPLTINLHTALCCH